MAKRVKRSTAIRQARKATAERKRAALAVRMNDLDLFGDTDPDLCPNCGVNSQATHAPWCEERDGTPVDATDPVYFAGKLAVAVVAAHSRQCLTQPDWWQAVLVSFHDMLADATAT